MLLQKQNIRKLLTITECHRLTPDQYKIANEKAEKWTDFFLELDLHRVEYTYYGDSNKDLAKRKLYQELAIFITDEFRRYIDSNELSEVSNVRDKIKEIAKKYSFKIVINHIAPSDILDTMELTELQSLYRDLGIPDTPYMNDNNYLIDQILKKTWKTDYDSPKIPPLP